MVLPAAKAARPGDGVVVHRPDSYVVPNSGYHNCCAEEEMSAETVARMVAEEMMVMEERFIFVF